MYSLTKRRYGIAAFVDRTLFSGSRRDRYLSLRPRSTEMARAFYCAREFETAVSPCKWSLEVVQLATCYTVYVKVQHSNEYEAHSYGLQFAG